MGKGGSRGLRWTLIGIAFLFVVLLGAAAAVPFLVPIATFIPELSRIVSDKLNQPVSMETLELRMLPTPRVVAGGIRVGKRDLVKVGELEIVPDVMSFFSGTRTVRLIRADDVQVKEAALAIPKTLPKSEPGEPIHVKRVVMRRVKVYHSKARIPEVDIEAELLPGLELEVARIASRDGTLKVTADPQKGGAIALQVAAKNYTLPGGVPLKFDALDLEGTWKGDKRGDKLELTKIAGKLYGGEISGAARAEWGRQWQVAGEASVDGVDLVPLQAVLKKPAKLSGRLKTRVVFSAAARTPEQLLNAMSADGPFEIVGGAYNGVDLSKVSVTGGSTEGVTPFEQFTGSAEVRGLQVSINELCVRSPKVVAGGNVMIAPDEKLSGKLDVSMAKTGGFVGMPVVLSGTASEPSVRPTKGYMIGAAVGTLFLPVIGTSIGSSIGAKMSGAGGCK